MFVYTVRSTTGTEADSAILSKIEATQKVADTSKAGKRYTYKGFEFEDIDYVVMETMPGDKALRKVLGSKLVTLKAFFK